MRQTRSNAGVRGLIACVVGVASFLLSAQQADASPLGGWETGDPSGMTVPQRPHGQGLLVNTQYNRALADSWKANSTAPVTEIHVWMGVKQTDDLEALLGGPVDSPDETATIMFALMENLYLSIHDNVPAAGATPGHPGNTLRGYTLSDFNFGSTYNLNYAGGGNSLYDNGPHGWYDPAVDAGTYIANDRMTYIDLIFKNVPDPFIQQAGEIYWLDLTWKTADGFDVPVGWLTSLDAFDAPGGTDAAAVWGTRNPGDPFGPIAWTPIAYPAGFSQSGAVNLAFAVIPEPGALTLAMLGLAGGLFRRGREPVQSIGGRFIMS